MNIVAEAREYNIKLDDFLLINRLPDSWFEEGIDHVAVKAYSPDDYDALIERLAPTSQLISEVQMDGRRLAAAQLLGEYIMNFVTIFNPFAPIEWVEIMEARPEEQSDDPPRLDHEEIFLPRGLIPVRTVLNRKKILFSPQENTSHSWVSLIISPEGDELKFSDTRLGDIVEADLKAGRAKKL